MKREYVPRESPRWPEHHCDLRLDPAVRLCPQFDPTGIRTFPVASREDMGFRVLDDFCQEHIM